jgi:hypothetical protein
MEFSNDRLHHISELLFCHVIQLVPGHSTSNDCDVHSIGLSALGESPGTIADCAQSCQQKFPLPLFAMLLAGDQCGKMKIPQRRKVLSWGLHL